MEDEKTGEEDIPGREELPAPQELKPEVKPTDIPSKVSLSDIPLPEYMKGAAQPAARSTTTPKESEIERSMREIGIKTPPKGDKRIVAIAEGQRTEIDENGLPRIRTYARDVSEEIRKRGATLATIVGAERERAATQKIESTPQGQKIRPRNSIFIVGATLLVLLGGGALVGALIISSRHATIKTTELGIIYANKTAQVEVKKGMFVEALAEERSTATLSLGEIERITPLQNGTEMSAEAILTSLSAPSALARNVTRVMLGVHAFDRTQPFIIIETSYYDITFDAMLAWETSMAETLGDFFRPVNVGGPAPELHFTDGIFKNVDVRMSGNAWPIVYAFPERNLLIITTNENTLTEILTRLSVSVR